MHVLLPFYCYFMLETAVNCKYRFLAFLHKYKYSCVFSELVFLFLCTQSTSCMTAPNPLCALVWKQSTQYSPKHQRSATLGMCRKIYSTVVIFNMFMIPSKVNIHMHKWKKMHFSKCLNDAYGVDFILHSNLNNLADTFTWSDSKKCFSHAFETSRDQQMASM